MSHRASRYGNRQIFVVSDECISTPDAIGASVLFHPSEAVVAPHGLRLLLSLEQAAYSKSISNITTLNQTIAFQSRGEDDIIICMIEPGLYPTGASIANAINSAIAITDTDLASYIVCDYNSYTSHFSFQYSPQSTVVEDDPAFQIVSESTSCSDLLGLTATELDTFLNRIESSVAANLTPCTAFLVSTSLSCSSIRSAGSAHSGSGVIARVPTFGLLNSQAFVMESWAPFNSHRCLLHENNITELRIDLVDSRTGAPIVFSDARSWELTFLVEFVHLPDAIEKSTVDSQVGLTISNANTSTLNPDGTVSETRETNRKSEQSGVQSGTAVIENRKKNKRRRKRRGGTSRTA